MYCTNASFSNIYAENCKSKYILTFHCIAVAKLIHDVKTTPQYNISHTLIVLYVPKSRDFTLSICGCHAPCPEMILNEWRRSEFSVFVGKHTQQTITCVLCGLRKTTELCRCVPRN